MIVRAPRKAGFTTVQNTFIDDDRIGFKSKGLMIYILSKPDHWSISERSLASIGPDGRDSVGSALRELEDNGYVKRTRSRNDDGTFTWTSTVYETPTENLTVDGFSSHGSTVHGKALHIVNTDQESTDQVKLLVAHENAQPHHTNGAHQKAVGESGTPVSPSFFDEPTFGKGVKTVNGKGQSGTTNSSARKQKKVADPEKVAQDWLWIERLADILGMDSKINAGRLGKTRNALRTSGYTLDDLDIYAREVWPSSWKAKNEAHPKENDLREGILEARKIRERRAERVEPAVRADGMFTLADPFGENLVVK